MADLFANATLKKKLTGITMLVCSIVLLLTFAAFIAAEIFSFRKVMVSNNASLAEVIAANSSIALTFNDRDLAQNTLEALASQPDIQLAYIFDKRNQPFARYYRCKGQAEEHASRRLELSEPELKQLAEGVSAGKKSSRFSSSHLTTFCPVYFEGNPVGMVYLNADIGPFYNWLHFFAGAGLLVVGVSFLLAYLLSLRLQELVSRPILYLVEKMNHVRREEDFSIRAEKTSDDEVGSLVDGFNSMLSRVEERDGQLERYRHHLEDLVFKRTSELHEANQKLQQTVVELETAKTKIEAASHAKSQFLTSISHELRTPMVGVLGTSELLLASSLDYYQRNLVETLLESGEGLLTLLNDLLDLSKIEAGKLVLEHIDFSLAEIIETPVKLLAKGARDKNLELLCRCEPDVPRHLRGDPGRLRQVIFNLVGNAIKFTPAGEVALHVKLVRQQTDRATLRFLVSDTGIGIAPAARERIFDAFCQADNSVTRKFGGTGLGLSIVKQLVEKMGGKIGLSSEQGTGSLFYFTVDLEVPEKVERDRISHGKKGTGKRVLVVDDSLAVRQMFRERFKAEGFEVVTAASCEEGWSHLQNGQDAGNAFYAVVLDEELPGEDSRRLAELLTESGFDGWLVAVKNRDNMPCGELDGVDAVIYRPLLPSVVDECLAKILEGPPSPLKAPPKSVQDPDGGAEDEKELVKRRGRILVAEDNVTTQNLLKISLGSAGHEVVVAGDGKSALDIWRNSSFDLILMDFNMPEMDGCTVTRQIRATGWRHPIVGLTAHTSDNHVEQCREAGMDDYLCKPFKQKQLHQVVEKWLAEGVFSGAG
ncbi:MAG: response regulator [Syntrophotaleaceae bacterium]